MSDESPRERLGKALITPFPDDELWAAFLDAIASEFDELEIEFDEVDTQKFVRTADGERLDRHGEFFQAARKTNQSDDVYRARLETHLRRFLASGTTDEIIEAIAALLDIDRETVTIVEPEDEPLMIEPRLRADDLGETGIPPDVLEDLLDDISAAGVNADAILLADEYAIAIRYGSSSSRHLGQFGLWFGFRDFDGEGAFGAGEATDVKGTTTTPAATVVLEYDPMSPTTLVADGFGAGAFDGTETFD